METTARGRTGRWRGRTATVLAIACLGSAADGTASAAAPADFIGVQATDGHETTDRGKRAAAYATQAQSGLGVVRVWFYWSDIETQRGRFDFSLYDQLVEDAARSRVRLLPVLIDPPAFRTSAPPGPQRGTYPPARAADMAAFASMVVGRYGPSGEFWDAHPGLPRLPVHSWQVWNEPNIWPWWGPGPDPAAYTQLLRTVAGGIRRCDPRAEVVAAGLPNSNAPGIKADDYVAGMYEAGAGGAFDTLALHPYGATEERVVGQVESLRATIARHGDEAPIWVTEYGWGTGGPRTSLTVSRAEQADLVAGTASTLHVRRAELGVRGAVYYQWADGTPRTPADDSVWFHVGLVDRTRAPKPALGSLSAAIEAMGLEARQPSSPGRPLAEPCRLTPARTASPAALTGPGGPAAGTATGPRGGAGAGGSRGATVPRSPVLRGARLKPARFRPAGSGPAASPVARCGPRTACGRAGARLSFRVSEPGTLELRLRRVRAKRVRDVPGVVRQRVRSGSSALRLLGRAGKRRLAPGVYRAVLQLVARDGRRSRPATVRFTILR